MQIFNTSSAMPANNQRVQFQSARFWKVPPELQQVMQKDPSFATLSKSCDVFVEAMPKLTFKDPFRLRVPKADEKAYLSCRIVDDESEFAYRLAPIATDGKLLAPLNQHVETLLGHVRELAISMLAK